LGKLDGHHFSAFFTLNPLDALELGINEEGVTFAGHHNTGILKRDAISGQALCLPDSLVRGSGKNFKRIDTISEGNLLLNNVIKPLLRPKHGTENRVEGTDVGYESGRDQSVTNHSKTFKLESFNIGHPTYTFISKTVNETVSKRKLTSQFLGIVNDSLFLSDSFCKLLLEFINFVNDNLDFSLHFGELSHLFVSQFLSGSSRFHQRRYLLVDRVIFHNVNNPITQVTSSRRLLSHNFESEVRFFKNRGDICKELIGNIVTIVTLNRVQESLGVTHHLLSVTPTVILTITLKDKHGLGNKDTSRRGSCKRLKLLNGLDLETVDGVLSSLHGGDSLFELYVSRVLGSLSGSSALVSFNSLNIGSVFLNGGGS
jgi:hypothetical protein